MSLESSTAREWEARVGGAWMGLAIGEAMGRPATGLKEGTIRTLFPNTGAYMDPTPLARDKPERWSMPGLYGSITQQAILFLESASLRGRLDPQEIVSRMLAMAQSEAGRDGAWRNAGQAMRTSLAALREATRWDLAGQNRMDAEAAGPAMALALSLHQASEKELLSSLLSGVLITHHDPSSVSAAVAMGCLIRDLLKESDLNPGDVFRRASFWAEQAEHLLFESWPDLRLSTPKAHQGAMSRVFHESGDMIHTDLSQVFTSLARLTGEITGRHITRPNIHLALGCVPLALHLLFSPGTPPDAALSNAVRLGGDARTMGSIMGTIAGLLHGQEAWPMEWIRGLGNRKQIELRKEWIITGQKPSGMKDMVIMETELTRAEEERRTSFSRRVRHAREKDRRDTASPSTLLESTVVLKGPPSKMEKQKRRRFERNKTQRLRDRRR